MTTKKSGMRLIGKAPTHIEKEDLLDYFLYAFEFSWNSPIFEDRKSKLDEVFKNKAESLFPDYESFSVERTWWLYVLIGLQEITYHQELEFGKETVDYLLKRFTALSEEALEQQINEIQHAFYDEIPDILLVRPLELKALQNSTIEHDKYLPFFIENHERMVKVIQKHLNQKDIDKDYFERFTMTNKKRLRKFSSFWNGYYEIFTNYFLSIYNFQMPLEPQEIEEELELIEEMIILFLVASVVNKPKIEPLAYDLTEILREFVEDFGSHLQNE